MRISHGVLGVVAFGALVALPTQPSDHLVRIYGDPVTADQMAIIVPGADVTVENFDTGTARPGGAARALLAEAARLAPGARLAVVAWLGYDSPPTVSPDLLTDALATDGAVALRRTVADLRERTTAPISLLCHSYGSVLCARAVPGLPVTDLAVFGSPGLGVPSATALTHLRTPATGTRVHRPAPMTAPVSASAEAESGGPGSRLPDNREDAFPARSAADTDVPSAGVANATGEPSIARTETPSTEAAGLTVLPATGVVHQTAPPLRVWAGRGDNDWIRFVPGVELGPFGFGADPTRADFGARIFQVGAGGHSDYFTPGTHSLRNLALIALGRADEVTSPMT